jgi:coenzyme F420 hydrogenase subunit beta
VGRAIRTIQDVVAWNLCTGCGACYYACSKGAVTLTDVQAAGIRPTFDSSCASCTECLSICPGHHLDAELATGHTANPEDFDFESGPALEVWEGYAADRELRFRASSGGLLSAIALYCLEREQMEFVLHTGMNDAKPWTNKTVQSRNRHELLERTGSRYAPASPCDGLRSIEKSSKPCVFIGKPCDAAAVTMLRKERSELDRNLGLVLTFFCAGTPSTRATLNLIESLDMSRNDITAVSYRGQGWPGEFRVISNDGGRQKSLSYKESWGRLSHYRPLRCQLCPDGLGRIADISCGDAWERFEGSGDMGRSIAVVRTRKGQEILHKAVEAGYLKVEAVGRAAINAGQPSQINRSRQLFGRLLAMRLLLIPTPRFQGFSLFRGWIKLPLSTKFRTLLGTFKRASLRGLYRRSPVIKGAK